MTKKLLVTLIQYIVFLGLAVLLIWWQATRITPGEKDQMLIAFGQVQDRAWLLIPIFLIGFFSHFFRALRWKLLLEPINLRPSTFGITSAVLIGYLVNLLLPRMGEVARCTVLARSEREPADKIIGTIVAERSFDLLCLILITLAAFLLQADIVSEYFSREMAAYSSKGPAIALAAVLAIAGVLLLVWIYRKTKGTKLGLFIAGMGAGVRSILQMKKRGLFLFHTFMIWLCYFGQIYVGFHCIAATENLSLLAALAVLIFGSIGMIVTPGGLGAYPIAVQKILTVYGIGQAYGFSFGWLAWSTQTGTLLILGILALLILPAYNRYRDAKNTMDRA